jgi:hypothetical protein
MNNWEIEKRKKEIEEAYQAYPWLAKYLCRDNLKELHVKRADAAFFKTMPDDYHHMEVWYLLGQNGELLKAVGMETVQPERKTLFLSQNDDQRIVLVRETVGDAILKMHQKGVLGFFVLIIQNADMANVYILQEGEMLAYGAMKAKRLNQ